MFKVIADNRETNSVATKLRRKRAEFLGNLLAGLEVPIRILDVGGTEAYWRMNKLIDGGKIFITLLNLNAMDVSLPNCVSVAGDALKLDFGDNSFDVIFSNSVIEHVGSYENQARMATEVCRVGKRYFVQTPNKYFVIEPHFVFPLFQFLPLFFRVWLLQHFDLGWIKRTPNKREARRIISSIRLLSKREFIKLFPDAKIYEEKLLGITKSFIAYGGWN
jgi:ubiquinone/menaquinone biosynthesis C-methylase UbiE